MNVQTYLKKRGFFLNAIDSLQKNSNKYIAFFSLGNQVKKARISFDKKNKDYLSNYELKSDSLDISVFGLERLLESISKQLDREGKSFSEVRLKNINLKNDILYADLFIKTSEKRKVNKVIVRGYEKFPKSYLKNYYNLKENTVFSNTKIEEISTLTKNLQFVEEIKTPEVLFTKDSTQLYIYIEKRKNSSFDGIVNFASKENGGVLFNGNIDLQLNNILNTGENFSLFWNSVAEERQEFKISTRVPYVFNSRISPELSFSIYKQDSTFLNTKFDLRFLYTLSSKSQIGLTYISESSNDLESNSNSIESFESNFVGAKYEYRILNNDNFFNDKFYLSINPLLGSRKSKNKQSTQLKFLLESSYVFDINLKNTIFIRNETGILDSDEFFDNEIFRIGGANSIRGFNEQTIFARNYSYFNTEYRLSISSSSYLHTIIDIGFTQENNTNNSLLGLGFGYVFKKKNFLFNIAIATNTNSDDIFLSESKLILNFRSYF